ncbi:hypothetical protein [Natrinema salifodinae]|uniref:Uncharacterized protein n=1 Tax=Natrinema salifodinae TaxID=1202768 RepID=A0A1I0MK97_9EURY|nr:hypothetical protein [Natrinema salifodinae]SEV88816.1 hypothetical protein SAMN05216285_1087 [Natrinema salifodinae]
MGPARSNSSEQTGSLQSRSYRITVDDGRESFFALSIEDVTCDDAWVMSDTVVALENMR